MYKNKEIKDILSFVAPGTEIRKGLNNILDAGTGGLLVIGDDKGILEIIDGGFFIDCDYNPQRIYELAKMDGAIILSKDINKILYANVQLQPNPKIETTESGTRHRTAERVAKQTGELVISISQKRKRISIYKNNIKYLLRDISVIMTEASQAMKTLERYKEVLVKSLTNLTMMEFDDLVTLYEVCMIIQKFELMVRISKALKLNIIELGTEGTLLSLQLDEIMNEINIEIQDLIRDYYKIEEETENEDIFEKLEELTEEELLDLKNISYILGYKRSYASLDTKVVPKGFRILGKIIRLTTKDIKILVSHFDGLNNILSASEEELAEIDNISKFKAKIIKNGIRRLRFTIELEKK
ncbi:diadenylate cyclase [Hypnocyclicus thermotrophus]|uniref:diadenylate cyclase n=1 Tax=Hypnocyclicus thermotrophus TaxID=1627895 RepID=A0AA46I5K4_9FUSO|nr:DNA integrity scanning diadenylate cyclase DisA [Hypnocyclicus thermotrophus]TDT70433.1 diadenylate cyclase [Hypnocyclicus thermotrophus]